MLRDGSEIAGYRIEGVLGRGGMGRVYEATQLSLDRTVALKILSDDLGTDEAFRARFRHEGRVQGALAHPHIVAVLEAGEADGHLFIAMQLVRGPTLKRMISDGELDPHRALDLLTQVADALDTAHAAGLTHRDIKPQNILVGRGDHAYLADFGLTKTLADSAGYTRTGQFVGTIDYISPEQITGDPATPASDIYAVGAILYEALIGDVPFPRDSEAAVLFAHVSSDPPRVSEIRPELPTALDAVVARALAKDPADRPATASALIDAARDALAGRGIEFGPTRGAATTAAEKESGGPQTLNPPSTDADFPPTMEPGSRLVPPESDPSLTVPDHPPVDLGGPGAAVAESSQRGTTTSARVRRGVLGGAGALVLGAAVGGMLLGGSGAAAPAAPAPLISSASNELLSLSFPAGWSERPGPSAAGRALRLTSALAVGQASGGATLDVGLVTGATTAQLLSAPALRAVTGRLPSPSRIRVGPLSAYRYDGMQMRGVPGVMTLLAAPTTEGVVTVACTRTGAASRDCERIAASLRLRRGSPASLGADAAYARTLSTALLALNESRTIARRHLGAAKGPKGQATAAAAAAAAYARAVRAVSGAKPGPAERAANAQLVSALREAGDAYSALGHASRRARRGAYAIVTEHIRDGERSVGVALASLGQLGYRVG